MSAKVSMCATILLAAALFPRAASAMGAGAGCADLPEYDRAVGALEGMTGACDMSVEQARRIVAAQQAAQHPLPQPAVVHHRRRHRVTPPVQ